MDNQESAEEFAAEVSHTTAGECVVRIQGVLDWHTYLRLESILASFLSDSGPQRLVLDLTAVSYLDSSGLAALVRARSALWQRGGTVSLHGCQPVVQYALDRTRLAYLFEIVGAQSTSS